MASDEDDWDVNYPVESVEWLTDTMEALEFKFTPAQILETEELYPGLWNNVGIILWQRKLINEQEGGE